MAGQKMLCRSFPARQIGLASSSRRHPEVVHRRFRRRRARRTEPHVLPDVSVWNLVVRRGDVAHTKVARCRCTHDGAAVGHRRDRGNRREIAKLAPRSRDRPRARANRVRRRGAWCSVGAAYEVHGDGVADAHGATRRGRGIGRDIRRADEIVFVVRNRVTHGTRTEEAACAAAGAVYVAGGERGGDSGDAGQVGEKSESHAARYPWADGARIRRPT